LRIEGAVHARPTRGALTASVGYELQIASGPAIVLMGAGALLMLEQVLKAEYLVVFGRGEGRGKGVRTR
jgi:hypothetical protein